MPTPNYENARRNVAACLGLARDCHAAYSQSDDHTRQLLNHAFFNRIDIDEDGTVRFDFHPPFDTLLMRLVPAGAHTQRAKPSHNKKTRQHELAG